MRLPMLFLILAVGSVFGRPDGSGSTGPEKTPASELKICWDLFEKGDYAACTTRLAEVERRNKRPTDAERSERLALMGSLALVKGDPSKATALLNDGLVLFLQGKGTPVAGRRIYRSLGRIAYEEGDYHKAIGLYREQAVLEYARDEPKPGALGGAEYNIGNCFWGMDQRDSCKVHYDLALQHWRKGDTLHNPMISYIYEVLGSYAWDEGDERSALSLFDLSAAHHLRNASGTDAADGYVRDAKANEATGDQEAALQFYQRALEFRVTQYGATNPNAACMHTDIAHMLAGMGRNREALERAQQAICLFVPSFRPADLYAHPVSADSATSQRLLLDALLVKFDILRADTSNSRSGASTEALIDLCLQVIERLRIGAEAEGSKLFWSDHVRGFIESALEHCHGRFNANDPVMIHRVLTLMESGRNALLADALRSLDARKVGGLPDSIARAEGELKRHIAEMRRYIVLEQKKCERMDADKVGLWRKAVAAGEADLDRLVSRIASAYPAYHELKYAASDIDPHAVIQRLGKERSLLCLFIGTKALYILLLDDRGAQLMREEDVAGISNATNELRGALRDHEAALSDPQGSYSLFVKGASALYDHVFAKLQPLPYAHMVIMPDGAFHYVPFDVFLVEEPTGQQRDYAGLHYLIKDHTVQVVPMLRPWLKATRGRSDARSAYLGMAPTYDGTDLAPLRSNAREVQRAEAAIGGIVLEGDVASETAFKRNAGAATVLHLAMHTKMDMIDPMQLALAFGRADTSNDGLLNMYELYGMDLHASLALLSACNTGTGPLLGGEGIMSMARAFQYAGCPSVMMNLWACDDETSGAIVAAFFDHLREGEELDDALRSVKLAHLQGSDPQKAHPYYWATLVLLGDERPIDLSQPWYFSPWIWASLAALLVLVGGPFLRKRFQ